MCALNTYSDGNPPPVNQVKVFQTILSKRSPPVHKVVENDAERVEVRLGEEELAQENFGRHVV